MSKTTCLECKTPFTGRIDKRFCSGDCRSAYYNKLNRAQTNYMRRINYILRKNRRILEELNPNGKTKVHYKHLMEKGFDFGFFTNIYTTKKGTVYYFCYEHGYLELEEGFYALVTREVSG